MASILDDIANDPSLGAIDNQPSAIDNQAAALDQQLATLERYKSSITPGYQDSYKRYLEMLAPMTQAPRRASIYDLASNLSKGLTAQAQSGQPPSIGGGLAAGFNSFSDYANAIDKGNEDMLASIRTKAATLAIQDEQAGKKLYNSLLAQYVLKDPSKLGDVEFFVKRNADGEVIATRTAYAKDKTEIDALAADGYVPRPSDPTTSIDLGDKTRAKVGADMVDRAAQRVKEVRASADAAGTNTQSIDKFEFLANEIGEEGFGRLNDVTGQISEWTNDLPIVGNYISDQNVGARQAVKNTQMDFIMGIVGPYKGAISNKELAIFQSSVAGLANDWEANNYLMVVGRRANEIKQAHALALQARFTELYGQWENEEINSAELDLEMARFDHQWQLENRLFDEATLQILGRGEDNMAREGESARDFYIRDAMNNGVSREDAKRIADLDAAERKKYMAHRTSWVSDYNKQLADEAARNTTTYVR